MGGAGNSKPTAQQLQLQTQQAMTTANLNLEENAQRKSILNAMQGTRVFRGSALSRAVAGNSPGTQTPLPGPSATQQNAGVLAATRTQSLLDENAATASGSTPAGGVGGSGGGGVTAGSVYGAGRTARGYGGQA